MKGHTMRKYINMDFDEKGKPVLGRAKDTATGGFVPTTWAPPAPSVDGNGIKSITISPSITTTPALDSLFPIYYENLTEEQKQQGVMLLLETDTAVEIGEEFTFTVTPTANMYVIASEPGGKGEPITVTGQVVELGGEKGIRVESVICSTTIEEPAEDDFFFSVGLSIVCSGK